MRELRPPCRSHTSTSVPVPAPTAALLPFPTDACRARSQLSCPPTGLDEPRQCVLFARRYLSQRGVRRVVAIDPAALDASVAARPGVEHWPMTAAAALPRLAALAGQ